MRIYKMTATFGKLDHETLTLEPGLNVITAPNEWGKSTWCAFLLAMLYGLDTRAKSTKTTLADKERYAPWSGAPMEGRIDLSWQGRDITIERRTKRRVPLGEFSAYETASGLPVPELTAANCGQALLGVEQTVFRRAGFIRHADLPVTQDEALRRRLNALVTTGDESGGGDRLADSLKDLKNRVRYNRSGLLPQAEREREALEGKLEELAELETQCEKLKTRLEEAEEWQKKLEDHRQALLYTSAQESLRRRDQAEKARDQAAGALADLEAQCEKLPPLEEAQEKLRDLEDLREQCGAIVMERQALPESAAEPQLPPPFGGMTPESARKMAEQDGARYRAAAGAKAPVILLLLGILGLAGAALLAFLKVYVPAGVAAGAALAGLIWSIRERGLLKKQAAEVLKKYGNPDWKHWADPIDRYEGEYRAYAAAEKARREASGDIEVRWMALQKKWDSLCGAQAPEVLVEFWQQVRDQWEACLAARREYAQAQSHFEALDAVVQTVEPPAGEDTLSYSRADTERLLADCAGERQRLQGRLGQYQGRMESLGDRGELQGKLEKSSRRIRQLEDTYSALTIAQETLADARAELQRRFAPRIAKRAQELLGRMTGGRYHSLTMAEDLSLQASAGEETTLREGLWRSDGTVDQLYLSLRLAVASELTPEAPLILDDALVRFDDQRMGEAVAILRELAEEKQVILFTCQGREETA